LFGKWGESKLHTIKDTLIKPRFLEYHHHISCC
jgi:hypothetical protein